MPLNPCREAVRVLVFAASLASAAAAQAAPDENAIKLDQAEQGIKDEVLKFNGDAERVEQNALYPPYSRADVFLGVRVGALLIHEISITIDNGAPQKLSLASNEGKALLGSGNLVRLLRTNLDPGPHRIRAEFTAQFADAKPKAALLTGHYEALFDKDYGPTALELTLARATSLSKPGLSLRQWRPAR